MGRHGDWRVRGAREGGEGVGLGPTGPGCHAEAFGPYTVVDGTRGGHEQLCSSGKLKVIRLTSGRRKFQEQLASGGGGGVPSVVQVRDDHLLD